MKLLVVHVCVCVLIGHASANPARQMEPFLKSSGFISHSTSGKEPVEGVWKGGAGGGGDFQSITCKLTNQIC